MSATVAFSSPFVPPEWIMAHGLMPLRLIPGPSATAAGAGGAGVCPFAHDFLQAVIAPGAADAVIFTSTCDQMRRIAPLAAGRIPTFLMHVPATWQNVSSLELYIAELQRLSGFLQSCGGTAPTDDHLQATIIEYDPHRQKKSSSVEPRGAIRLALVGGPLRRQDTWIIRHIESHGGTVVLDATETGERTVPAPFVEAALRADPLRELARAYFHAIPDVFRRPDSLLHEYLQREVQARRVQALLLIRCVWCDQWHAQAQRLKASLPVPLVEIDLAQDNYDMPRNATRIDSLLDMLR